MPVNAADHVEAALRTQSPNVSGPFPSPVSPIQVVALTVPMVREGEAIYALRGILAVESFNRLMSAERLPQGWVAGIADANGTVVARSHEDIGSWCRDLGDQVGTPIDIDVGLEDVFFYLTLRQQGEGTRF